jgi:hypothetical protein
MKVLMHALAASCEELRARTGNPPLYRLLVTGCCELVVINLFTNLFRADDIRLVGTTCSESVGLTNPRPDFGVNSGAGAAV